MERDSLNLRIQHLETDLRSVQQELTDTQIRYSSLQAQKLSSMTSNAANRTLKQQIEELEARVMRRTEQIGIHQHDIRRMETNLRLQEERIAEMTVELETLSSQKEAMVEDCAEAREACDLALQQIEAMEIKMEAAEDRMLTQEHDREKDVAALVCVVADTITRTRGTVLKMKHLIRVQLENQKLLLDKLRHAEEVKQLAVNHARFLESGASSTADAVQDCCQITAQEARQAILALAVSHKTCGKYARSLERMVTLKTSMEAKIREQQDTIMGATTQISSLQYQLETARGERLLDGQLNLGVGSRIAGHEDQIQSLQRTMGEVEYRHVHTVAELTRSNDELRVRIELDTELDTEQVQAEDDLRKELERLNALHAEEIQSLQGRLDNATAEFVQVQHEQSVREDEYQQLQCELSRMKDDLHARTSEVVEHLDAKTLLENGFAQARRTHLDYVDRRQQDLDQALQNSDEKSHMRVELERQHDTAVKGLLDVKEKIQMRLDQVQAECAALQQRLDEEVNRRDQEQRTYREELRCTVDRSHNTEAELHQEIMALRVELKKEGLKVGSLLA